MRAITKAWYVQSLLALCEAIFAVCKAYHCRAEGLSAYAIQKGVLMYYTTNKLFPPGLCAELPCVDVWSFKVGNALKRLATSSV